MAAVNSAIGFVGLWAIRDKPPGPPTNHSACSRTWHEDWRWIRFEYLGAQFAHHGGRACRYWL